MSNPEVRPSLTLKEWLNQQPSVRAVEQHLPIQDSGQLLEVLAKASKSLRINYQDFVGKYYQVNELKALEHDWQARARRQQRRDTSSQAEAKFLSQAQELLVPYLAAKYDWFGVFKNEKGADLDPRAQKELPQFNLATEYDDLHDKHKTDAIFKVGDLVVGFDFTNERDERALQQKDLSLQSLYSNKSGESFLTTLNFVDAKTKDDPVLRGGATNVPHFMIGLDIDQGGRLARMVFDEPAKKRTIAAGKNTVSGIENLVEAEIKKWQRLVLIQLRFATEVLGRVVAKRYQEVLKRRPNDSALNQLALAQNHSEQARDFFQLAFDKELASHPELTVSEYIIKAPKDGAYLAQLGHTALTLIKEFPEFKARLLTPKEVPRPQTDEDEKLDEFLRAALDAMGTERFRKTLLQDPGRPLT